MPFEPCLETFLVEPFVPAIAQPDGDEETRVDLARRIGLSGGGGLEEFVDKTSPPPPLCRERWLCLKFCCWRLFSFFPPSRRDAHGCLDAQAMAKETHRQFKELSDEGDACLVRLRSVDKTVGETFLKFREVGPCFGDVLVTFQELVDGVIGVILGTTLDLEGDTPMKVIG